MKDHPFQAAGDTSRGTFSHVLDTGVLDLDLDDPAGHTLFRVAERQNPRRAFLFVSTVLGRHIPVAPHAHRAALDALTTRALDHLLDGPVFVMGFAETAVGIGAGVFDGLARNLPGRRIGYAHTTRHVPAGRDPWFTIVEGHSHATDHAIMPPGPGVCHPGQDSTLVLVDDESTTGTTFAKLAGGLFSNGAKFGRIVLVTLTDWSGGDAVSRVAAAAGIDDVRSVSLTTGSWQWSQDPAAGRSQLPPRVPSGCPAWISGIDQPWQAPRNGLAGEDVETGAELLRGLALPAVSGRGPVLVIGSGEHVWQPFLVAEAIEVAGHETAFIATTRSPIRPGPVISHKITFPDHFGIGLEMYLHNVDPRNWADILLFVETSSAGVPHALRERIGKGWIIDGHGQVSPMHSLQGDIS